MDEPRMDRAMTRIEAALTRIEGSARKIPSAKTRDALRWRVGATLEELDALIAGLEQ